MLRRFGYNEYPFTEMMVKCLCTSEAEFAKNLSKLAATSRQTITEEVSQTYHLFHTEENQSNCAASRITKYIFNYCLNSTVQERDGRATNLLTMVSVRPSSWLVVDS